MRVCINRIAASTENPSRASAVVSTATSCRLNSSRVDIAARKPESAAQAGVAKASALVANPITPLRASDEHDSSVRRIDPITPDILRAPRQHQFARGIFPTARESKDNIAKGTPGVRVQTVNGAGEKSGQARVPKAIGRSLRCDPAPIK